MDCRKARLRSRSLRSCEEGKTAPVACALWQAISKVARRSNKTHSSGHAGNCQAKLVQNLNLTYQVRILVLKPHEPQYGTCCGPLEIRPPRRRPNRGPCG